MRFVQILLILFTRSILVMGQTYLWNPYTTENSLLESNNLSSLYLDHNDILWVGSDSGLTGYNGSAWISYKTPISDLASDSIRSIQVNTENIWLGTNKGLSTGHIQAFDSIVWNTPYRTDNSELIDNNINAINIDSLGTCWICTDSGITVITDTTWESAIFYDYNFKMKVKILSINQKPTSLQYVGTQNGGVCRLTYNVDGVSGASTIWKQFSGLLSDTIQAVLVDKNGDRWFGTPNGLSFHTGENPKNPYSWQSFTKDIGMVHNNVQALAEDSTGAIWIGTSSGVSKLLPVDTTWTNFTIDSGLVSNDVRDIAVAKNGEIWFATSGGLSKLTIMANSISNNGDKILRSFDVYPAYPNPFNMSTTIKFQLAGSTRIKISIYDITGRLVNTILNSHLMPGVYTVNWNGKNISGNDTTSGVYFAVIHSSNQTSRLKLILVK